MSNSSRGRPNFLDVIRGEALSSVEFVQDYVQLRFDGATLTAYTRPHLSVAGKIFSWGDQGYRDALCAEIGMLVRNTDVEGGKGISIIFEDGAILNISLRDEDYRGPEALEFSTSNGQPWVVL